LKKKDNNAQHYGFLVQASAYSYKAVEIDLCLTSHFALMVALE